MQRRAPSRFDNVDLTPHPLPPDLSAVTCRDVLGWWMECQCTSGAPYCQGGATHYPMRMLLERYHCDAVPVLDVARRLRCRRCRAKPSGLRLVDDVQRLPSAHSGIPPGGGTAAMVIDLLPQLAAWARGASCALPVTGTLWLEPITPRDLARDPAKRRLLRQTFGLEGGEGGPLLGADRGLGGGELVARKG